MTAAVGPGGMGRIGQVVSGRYEILKLLGEGGMGAVYLAEHTLMRKRFALKMLHGEMATNEEVLARFRREAEAAAHLEHPHVAAATDFGQTEDGSFFLVLEYVDGSALRSALDGRPMPPERALKIARQIALALERAHSAGIVHRDLKPENVMLVRREEDPDFVKVLDFGVARFEPAAERDAAAQALTKLGTIMGTPEYMAPEQALGERVTPRADLYALGVMLFEMLTGQRPFEGDATAVMSLHMIAPVPTFAERGVSLPAMIEAVVRRLLEKDANARHESARALIDAIDQAAAASGFVAAIGPPSSDRMRISIAGVSGTESQPFAKTAIAIPSAVPSVPGSRDRPTVQPTSERAIELARNAKTRVVGAAKRVRAHPRVEAALQAADEALGRLSEKTKLPRAVLVAIGAGVFGLISVTLLILVFKSSSSSSSSKATGGGPLAGISLPGLGPKKASADELRTATAKGPAELEALAGKYPHDPAVLRELAFALDARGRPSQALDAVRRLAAAAHDEKEEVPHDVVRIVIRAATRFEVADEAFRLLEDDLGDEGIEGLLELSERKDVPATTRTRAASSLAKPSVRDKASPPLALVLGLEAATTCDEKRDVLIRSGSQADARALAPLKALKSKRGCGRRKRYDCYRCLRSDDVLDRAIAAAEEHERR